MTCTNLGGFCVVVSLYTVIGVKRRYFKSETEYLGAIYPSMDIYIHVYISIYLFYIHIYGRQFGYREEQSSLLRGWGIKSHHLKR